MSTSKAKTTRAAAEAAIFGDLAQMRRSPTHPGQIFRDDYRKAQTPEIGLREAARRLGWSAPRIYEFERGTRGVTVENAIALAEATGTTAAFWLNLQQQYDLWQALQERRKSAAPDVKRIA